MMLQEERWDVLRVVAPLCTITAHDFSFHATSLCFGLSRHLFLLSRKLFQNAAQSICRFVVVYFSSHSWVLFDFDLVVYDNYRIFEF